ncbi:LysE/ArgO family amino acid transporter [Falsarthrobacter nasiphocae]|uniref:L-lysine exporter family protein LysE/ArgO n=1 Tax=Falsarthrobacter nasiphocae TaxID=189863 RepID=A0AAE3YF92_9MICC|nr:LysE family transporter [Falsarthrobacter nasiphocae]MDR6891617.1 L-lysine exporter family protein LysE/ArgO [Falsarthrobacter nasiphocae]
MNADALAPLTTGFFAGLGLIVAIGAQNAYVLRQGIRREHVWVVVAICAGADLALIALGAASIGAVSSLAPWVLVALRWGGAAYLVWFAFTSFRSAVRGSDGLAAEAPRSAGSVALTALALTLLNPHVYLDTVLTLGTVVNRFGEHTWVAAAGAMAASLLWFPALGFGARALAPVFARPGVWRAVDAGVGVVMLAIAVLLVVG